MPERGVSEHTPTSADVAVLLAAGRGSRMRQAADVALKPAQVAAADRGLKMLVPIHGRPYLAYVLDEVAAAGFEEAVLVVGPDRDGAPDPVRAAVLALAEAPDPAAPRPPLRLAFAVQAAPNGSADALLAAEPAVGRRPFVVLNADNVYPCDVLRLLRSLEGPGLAAFDREALLRASNIPRERIAAFAVVEHDDDGRLTRIVEKPGAAELARAGAAAVSMTCWRFDASIFDACRQVRPSTRGELELPDAVAHAIGRGARFRVLPVHAGVLDISRREDIPILERLLKPRA
jgi:glucose-1-phosphate thymidylyltransferase